MRRILPVFALVAFLPFAAQSEDSPFKLPRFEKVTLEALLPEELRDDAKWQLDPNLSGEEQKKRVAEIDAAWRKPGYRNEGAAVFDVNRDGKLDITAGAWWYEGPDFTKKHPIRDLPQENEFCRNYGEFPYDL